MSTAKLRYGLIGVGSHGSFYSDFADLTGQIVALVDNNAENLERGATGMNIDHENCFAQTCPQFYRLVDAVIVATPADVRWPVTESLLNDKHVFCENPLATTLSAFRGIKPVVVARRELICTVNEQWRWCPGVIWASREVAAGRIGTLQMIRMAGKGRAARTELLRIGSHLLSVALHCFNVGIFVDIKTVVNSDHSAMIGTISTTNNVFLELALIPSEPHVQKCFLELIGTNGRIRLQGGLLENIFVSSDSQDTAWMIENSSSYRAVGDLKAAGVWTIKKGDEPMALADPKMNPTFWLINEFARAVAGETENPYPPSAYKEVVEILDLFLTYLNPTT